MNNDLFLHYISTVEKYTDHNSYKYGGLWQQLKRLIYIKSWKLLKTNSLERRPVAQLP